ncbi:hypothetical protein [Streptomyces sp. NPDC052496]|uniref:hypothetical protein n=1 Tax=Streptomyces sp. NPDC052496 TaxID=3154951 RepID=UPI0034434F92
MKYLKTFTGRTGFPQLQTRPDTAGHPAHYTASNRPHSPPGAGAVRTAARAATRTTTATATASPGHITTPHRTTPHLLSILGVLAVVLTLLFYGTAAAKGGKIPSRTAAGAAPVQAPDPTPTPAAPPGAHGPPTQVSPVQANSSTGIQYRRDSERDPGREKDKDRNQARRCTRAAPGAPSPCRRPLPPHPCASRAYPAAAFSLSHTGTAATLTTSRPGVSNRPALHCLHCVFRC